VQDALGERTDDGDRRRRRPVGAGERQDAVVGEHDDTSSGRLAGERAVLGEVDRGRGDVSVRIELGVELTGERTDVDEPLDGHVDVVLGDQTLLEGRPHALDRRPGVGVVVGEGVHAREERGRVGGDVGVVVPLRLDEVGRGSGVGDDEEGPVRPAPQLVEKLFGDVVGTPVDEVVGGHDRAHDPCLDGSAEGRQLVLVEHARAHLRRGDGAVRLVAVGEEVLERGHRLPDDGVATAQAARVGARQVCGEARVLGEPLLVAAPQRVAQRVDHRRPDVEAHRGVGRMLRAHLGGHRVADPLEELGVPGRGEPDRLREDGRRPEPGDTVQRFGAGAERCEPETLDTWADLVEECELLAERQLRDELVAAVRGVGRRCHGPDLVVCLVYHCRRPSIG
jgi:hypothetical protein